MGSIIKFVLVLVLDLNLPPRSRSRPRPRLKSSSSFSSSSSSSKSVNCSSPSPPAFPLIDIRKALPSTPPVNQTGQLVHKASKQSAATFAFHLESVPMPPPVLQPARPGRPHIPWSNRARHQRTSPAPDADACRCLPRC